MIRDKAQNYSEDIAIIGMNGRFPGAKNLDEFWQNLRDGVESITFFSSEELASLGIDADLLQNSNYVKANPLLEDIEMFDAAFFGLTPREAQLMDPQHRLFLQCDWEAFENAGYNTQAYDGRIGVYTGVSPSSYLVQNLLTNYDYRDLEEQVQIFTGNDADYLPTRVSYKMNLNGPSLHIGTACSTSLVAVHIACQALLNYECDIALSGGVTIQASQREGYVYKEGGILSPDGHCRAFDAKAQGTVFGSGIGVVILKRVSEALDDGDCIQALIKGSAINNDGSSKVSFTAPSVEGQSQVVAQALSESGVDPNTIGYIEAHGTGTALGDPIEIEGLRQVFRNMTNRKGFCAIGSLKTNIGHLNRAAGIAGLIKTVLALKYKMIPPTLHFEQPNPDIDFDDSPFLVNTSLREWRRNGVPRRAGISSLGFGGTNAHIIVEEAPERGASTTSRDWKLLNLSAKTPSALQAASQNLAEYLEQHPDVQLNDVAYTLQVGRQVFPHRQMLVCKNTTDALDALRNPSGNILTNIQETNKKDVVFMFPGQGSQYVNMGLALYETEQIFKEQIDLCSEILQPHLNINLCDVLYPKHVSMDIASQQLKQTEVAQPALFTVEYALSKLWMEWGVLPQAMIGHSIGEYVAACLAGVFTLEDALALVAARGRLMQQIQAGSMLAISLGEEEAQSFLDDSLCLAAVNSPTSCVVSGPKEAVDTLQYKLKKDKIPCISLHTSHAFHSTMLTPVLEPFHEQVAKIRLNPPQIPYISNVTGTWITDEEVIRPDYWTTHLSQTVRFNDGIHKLLQDSERIFLEVGPGRTLSALAKNHPKRYIGQEVLSSLRHPADSDEDTQFLLNTIGRLWLAGKQLDWDAFYKNEIRYRLPLPTYPFEEERYWIEPSTSLNKNHQKPGALQKQADIADWFYFPSWRRSIGAVREAGNEIDSKCWLVFVDEDGLGNQLINRLRQRGQDVVAVMAGPQYKKLSESLFVLDPNRDEKDYEVLIRDLIALGKIPDEIIHLWGVTPEHQSFPAIETFEERIEFFENTQNMGFYSLLFLSQAFVRHHLTNDMQITVVSNDMQKVAECEIICPDKATILGPVRVLPQELPNIQCRSIDISFPKSSTESSKKIIDQIMAELLGASTDQVLAFRGEYRWVQTFENIRIDGTVNRGKSRLRQGCVCLITGGLGGIGFTMADYLARTAQAKLILTGISEFPQRDAWEQWLVDHDDDDDVSQKIRKVYALEALGAEVMVAQCNAGDLEETRDLILQIEKRFGPLNGVIHAAGIFETLKAFRGIEETSREDCDRRFLPKVYGTLVLDELLRDRELDFCLMQSSLSSVLGGLGFVAYSAGNLFMDAFADLHCQTSRIPWMSVNWDGWIFRDPEEDIRNTSVISAGFASPSFGVVADIAVRPIEGAQALDYILSWGEVNQLLVSTADLQTRINQWVKLESLDATEDFSNSTYFHPRKELSNEYVAPTSEVETGLCEIFQELLGIKQVGIHDNYFELGGDSLLGIQVVSRISATFQVVPSVITMFENPTVAGLSEHIEALRWASESANMRSQVTLGEYEEGEV